MQKVVVDRLAVKYRPGFANGIICDHGFLHGFVATRLNRRAPGNPEFLLARPVQQSVATQEPFNLFISDRVIDFHDPILEWNDRVWTRVFSELNHSKLEILSI